jgi:hypothetical protein
MTLENKRYQLGNYIKLLEGTVVKITTISQDNVEVILNDKQIKLEYGQIYPIIISEEIMQSFGFKRLRKTEYSLHKMISYEKIINGKMYYPKVFIYNDNIIWHMKDISFKYVHQLQNILSIIEPKYKITLDVK